MAIVAIISASSAAPAQVGSGVGQAARIQVVDAPSMGAPPSGPHAVVVEHDQGLATHTVYRPAVLGSTPHPVLVWGEGACADNGLMFPEFLSEIASHGFVVIADGPPDPPVTAASGRGRDGVRGGAGGAAAPDGGQGPPRIEPDGADLIAAIDWLAREAEDPDSRFHGRVETNGVAAMGMSCGGLMAYGASADPRVATVGIWNSGLLEPDDRIFDGLHSPVIIITGGESDIAFQNGKRDFEVMPSGVPVFYGYYPAVGHGGTYSEDNGGAYGKAAVAWLKWHLLGESGPSGRGYFAGDTCGLCVDPDWVTDSRSLP